MTAARVRLLLAALLFCAWIGWLAYLAATTTHPVVLSRPQFLDAKLDVVAEVRRNPKPPAGADEGSADPVVELVEVLWPGDAPERKLKKLTVANLGEVSAQEGWQGPGRYVLPLDRKKQPDGSVEYEVASVGRSPGYPFGKAGIAGRSGPPRIYPATPEALAQEKRIRSGQWE